MKTFVFHFIRKLLVTLFIGLIVLFVGVMYYIEFELPDIEALNTVQLQVPLQIFTHDGKLMAEYGEKRRIPIPFAQIPKPLIDAVLATEDQRYFQHPGIDVPGLMRAALKLAVTGRKEEGGSTITMQVARSFYLTRHKTFGRKLREILLALKIDHHLSKQKILELYLNKIFLGSRAYGVAAAAEIYYGKNIQQLSLDQYAMLAGLPKAPSALNPIIYPVAAKRRRDHVLYRMYELGYIKQQDYADAIKTPLRASYHDLQTQIKAPYAAELVRQQLEQMYGDLIYTDGFNVYTTLDSQLQSIANESIHDGLLVYDQRHGYRGPEQNLGTPDLKDMMAWKKKISSIPVVNTLEAAVVMEVADQSVTALRGNGSLITIPWNGLSWARKKINADYLGRMPTTAGEILHPGDVIRVMPSDNSWRLSQIPKAEAGLVALNPQDGEILAMVGGFDFQNSNFNRITNALRQPGSSFKPFIYSAALDKGYTLASVINDAPIVIENPIDNTLWRPQNDTGRFYGPTRLRDALVHSRNLVSIRLLGLIGTNYAVTYAQRFGFSASQLPPALSLALGTASVTPLDMATGYAVFANNGFRITPFIIDDIRNSSGQVIYQAKPLTACATCPDELSPTELAAAKLLDDAPKPDAPPKPPVKDTTHAPRVISEQTAYLITSTLHDVIQYGTATEARSLRRKDLAGKTGTTSNQVDAWFVGYNSDLVALSWVGFDQPQSLHEYGAQAALPIWIQFMQTALRNKPEHVIDEPSGIVSLLVDSQSGLRADASDPNGIKEIFMEPYTPGEEREGGYENNENNENAENNETAPPGSQGPEEDDGGSGPGSSSGVSASNQASPEGGGGIY